MKKIGALVLLNLPTILGVVVTLAGTVAVAAATIHITQPSCWGLNALRCNN